jgi:hypothetical protein
LGTRKKNKKKLPTSPPPNWKNRAHHDCMPILAIGCMKFLFPKLLVTTFSLGAGFVTTTQRKKNNEKITRKKKSFPTSKMRFLFLFFSLNPSHFQTS